MTAPTWTVSRPVRVWRVRPGEWALLCPGDTVTGLDWQGGNRVAVYLREWCIIPPGRPGCVGDRPVPSKECLTVTDRPDNPPMTALSMRDWFAGLALEGCVEKQFSDALLAKLGSTEATSAAIAGAAYQIADACLAARQGGVDPMFAAIEERDALLAACLEVLNTVAYTEEDGRRIGGEIGMGAIRKLEAAAALARRPS